MVIRKINANGCHFLGAHRLSFTALANDDDDDDDDWHEIEHILRAQKYNEEREGRSGESSIVNERLDDAHNYQETEAQFSTRKATWGSPISIREARGSTDKLLDSEEERTIFSDEAEIETLEKEKITDKAGLIFNASRKRKTSCNGSTSGLDVVVKKAKRRPVNVWTKTSSRKGSKRNSKNGSAQVTPAKEDCVLLTPVLRNQDKIEDGPGLPILLSKIHKAERVELTSDRLSAGSTKGYRMVRATRGVTDGAWYFEITVEKLGPTGHTRLGWSTQKADVQAPVGFDSNSYAYRDLEGSKVHKATREPYGESYGEGDVIGFYINLPYGAELAPKPPEIVCYKGRPYLVETKEEPAQIVPGSEIVFFRNGVCQGTAYQDIIAGCYFPAASMYTLPDQPNCTVKFCFGPDFKFPPTDLGQRPIPQAMCFAPHCGRTTQELGSSGELDISQTSELKK